MRFKIHSNHRYTGGPDCVHQIAGALKRRGYYAAIVYPSGENQEKKGMLPYYGNLYGIDTAESREENVDEPDTVQVLPANWGPDWWPMSEDTAHCIQPRCEDPYKSTKVFYWLGWVDWQLWQVGGWERPIDLKHKNMQRVYHACQSQLTYDKIIASGLIKKERVFFLRDQTMDVFRHSEDEIRQSLPDRKNIVLYNPAKSPENAEAIKAMCGDLDCSFVPLTGMSHADMAKAGMEAKVYIDFGSHPGREKIPREMASCGCTVITGSDGTANNPIDVPSGSRKFFRIGGHYDWVAVKKQIMWDLENHQQAVDDLHMRHYRDMVRADKQQFENDVDGMLQTIHTYGNLAEA